MNATVCIDGLSLSVSSTDLHELAELYGSVARAWIVTTPAGGSLGFGYVEMATAVEAEALLELNERHSKLHAVCVRLTVDQ